MALPQPFSTTGQSLVNFDYTDVLLGNSYVRFYPTISNNSIYYLARQITDGQGDAISIVGSTSADYDFDSTFDVAAIVKGDAYFNYTTTTGSGASITVTLFVYHVTAGGTETQLGTASSPARGSLLTARENVKFTLTEKNFAVGEKLRLTVRLSHSGANTSEISIDPSSLLTKTDGFGRTVGTDMVANIPFKNLE